jgi:hypothetical protein
LCAARNPYFSRGNTSIATVPHPTPATQRDCAADGASTQHAASGSVRRIAAYPGALTVGGAEGKGFGGLAGYLAGVPQPGGSPTQAVVGGPTLTIQHVDEGSQVMASVVP